LPAIVLQFPKQLQPFLEVRGRLGVLTLTERRMTRREEGLRPYGPGGTGFARERTCQPGADLGHQAPDAPEARQSARDPEPELDLAAVLRPPERGPQVPGLVREAGQPPGLLRPGELRLGCLCQREEVVGVPAPGFFQLAPLDQLVGGELLDDLQELEARLAARPSGGACEAAVDERRQ
jgi:hypothetical protein